MRKLERITSAKVYQAVRKAMPKPTRAFRSKVVFKASSRKVWKQELESVPEHPEPCRAAGDGARFTLDHRLEL